MQILTSHNYYQIPGGEDQVFQSEADLLEKHGHSVYRYTLHNDQIKENGSALALAKKTLWNGDIYREVRSLIQTHKIAIAHFHNTFPLISPAAYYAAKAEGIPVIQTLHNYRLLCPGALFFRGGRVCEDCLGKSVPLPGILHGCYRESRVQTGAVTVMLTIHRMLRTWAKAVDIYVALTEFAREKFIAGGLPAEKIIVKSNFVPDCGIGRGRGGYALFVGRLSPEKGVLSLLSAWKQMGSLLPLKIVGDGPLAAQVSTAAQTIPGVEWLGHQPLEEVYSLLKEALFLVFPSEWYEGLPRILIESFSVGTPVLASHIGSMSSLVIPHQTGLHFQPGCIEDLVTQAKWLFANPAKLVQMRQTTRSQYEFLYAPEENYKQLMEIYMLAIDRRRAKS
jgi:glycosyltransferase involved in cell wall biosynthesis